MFQPMVHCVSSSEPDSGDRDGSMWGRSQNDSLDMSGTYSHWIVYLF